MEPRPIVEPVYLRFGQSEHHVGDLEIPYAVTLTQGMATATITVDAKAVPARLASLLRATADRLDSMGVPDAAAG